MGAALAARTASSATARRGVVSYGRMWRASNAPLVLKGARG